MEYYIDGELHEKGERNFSEPARVKQMGGIENGLKIFMEDYVYTYLYQYGRSGGGKEKLAVLIGRHYVVNGQETVVISGAIQGRETVQENGAECFSEGSWEYIGGQIQRYFKGMEIVGWVHCQPGFGAFLMAKDEGYHKEYFREKWKVLFALDTMDKLDSFYMYQEEGTGLRQAKGYFVYYDKNREMQEYMLENSLVRAREGAEMDPEDINEEIEEKTDRMRKSQTERLDAAQDIRRVLQKRERVVKQAKRERDRLLASVCCLLCVVCLSLGVAMFRSLDRLQMVENELVAMQRTFQILSDDFEGVKVQSVFSAKEVFPEKEMAEDKEERTIKYVVEGGDSLGYISRKFYGDHRGISKIMAVNGLADADMIYEGQVLWIPGI